MSVEVYSVSREGDRLLSPHFRVREFACHDGADTVKVDTALVALLEEIRAAAGGAVTITSGYRTPAYNAKVGGARYSQHLQGTAADITVAGAAPLLVGQMAEHYLGGRGGIGVYQTFTHVDARSGRARWDQRSGKEVAVSGWPGYEPPAEKSEADLAVEWITDNEIMLGSADGDLMLDDRPTRRQVAIMLYRFAKLLGRA